MYEEIEETDLQKTHNPFMNVRKYTSAPEKMGSVRRNKIGDVKIELIEKDVKFLTGNSYVMSRRIKHTVKTMPNRHCATLSFKINPNSPFSLVYG